MHLNFPCCVRYCILCRTAQTVEVLVLLRWYGRFYAKTQFRMQHRKYESMKSTVGASNPKTKIRVLRLHHDCKEPAIDVAILEVIQLCGMKITNHRVMRQFEPSDASAASRANGWASPPRRAPDTSFSGWPYPYGGETLLYGSVASLSAPLQ